MKNESYLMIKYFDDDVMEIFRERIGREKTAMMASTFSDFYKQALELLNNSVSPTSEEGQNFADELWKTLISLTDGEINLMLMIYEQIDKADRMINRSTKEHDAVRVFMNSALGAYHNIMGNEFYTNSAKRDLFLKLTELTGQAYKFYKEGVDSRSEKAQNFAKIFWSTLLELVDGDINKIKHFNENAMQSMGQDETVIKAREFMAAALDVYFQD